MWSPSSAGCDGGQGVEACQQRCPGDEECPQCNACMPGPASSCQQEANLLSLALAPTLCARNTPTHAVLLTGFDTRTSVAAGFGKLAMIADGICGMYQNVYQPGTVQRGSNSTKTTKQ
ncbi:hypothetical protein ABPG75_009977 [Micractinium tetrahymenae]